MQKLFVAIPTHDGRIHCSGMYSILQMLSHLSTKGVQCFFDFNMSSDIVQSRAYLAERFLASDFTHMLMIDTDLDFDPTAPWRLLESGHLVCGGAYPKKKAEGHLEFTVECEGPAIKGFRNASYIGAGLMMIHRQVFEKIRLTHPELTVTTPAGATFTSFFQNGIYDGRYRSEDAAFCHRWTKLGGKVWVLEDCWFGHFGTYRWAGNIADAIRQEEKAA
jgi:hypothetical protein